jgi:phage/plasmid-associated DNA primase
MLTVTKSIIDIVHQKILNKFDKSKTIDTSIYGKRPKWLMYGNSKSNESEPYKVNYLIDFNSGEKIKNHIDDTTLIQLSTIINRTNPISLNIQPIPKKITSKLIIYNSNNYYDSRSIRLIRSKLNGLSEKRYTNEKLWRHVGWCLKSASNNSSQIYDLWIEFSKKSMMDYEEKAAYTTWERGKENVYSWGTITTWLREDLKDNPEQFNSIMSKDAIYQILTNNRGWGHLTIAEILSILLDDNYRAVRTQKSSSLNGYTFYEFKNHIWTISRNGIPNSLRIILNDSLYKIFKKVEIILYQKKVGYSINNNDDKIVKTDKKIKDIKSAMSKIMNSHQYRNNILIDCITGFMGPVGIQEFFDTLNSNDHLTGFPNGIYDSSNNEFRDGIPSDNVSISLNGNYLTTVDNDVEQEMITCIKRVFPDDETFEYVMKVIALSVFEPQARNKCLLFCGDGGSGKSEFMKFLNFMLGGYFSILNMHFFTEKNIKPDSPSPGIMKLMDTRIVVSSELNNTLKFNLQRLKQLTGGMILCGRELYGILVEFMWKGLLLMDLNNLMDLEIVDRSISRRLLVVPCNTIFADDIDNAKNLYKHRPRIYQADPKYEQKLHKWTSEGHAITYLLNLYKDHIRNKDFNIVRNQPASIRKTTADYIYKYDLHRRYYDDRIEFTDRRTDKILRKSLYVEYKRWASENEYNNNIQTSKNRFFQYFERNYEMYFQNRKFLTHHQFKIMNNDDDYVDELND